MAAPFESRETRDFARETKFLIDASQADAVREWARAHLGRDPNGTGAHGDEYATTSLYFDTQDFHVYRKNNSYARGKFRVRRYGLLDFIFLERKMRTDRILAKRRTTVELDGLEKLGATTADPLWAGYWFQRRVLLRKLQPFVQISYDRTARLGAAADGSTLRMTVDTNLRVLPMPDRAFIPGVGFPLIEGHAIVEMKYRRDLPAVFKEAVATFGLKSAPLSKYRLGFDALGYVKPQEPETQGA